MVYNNVSTKSIIAKIYRDLDIQEENTRVADFVEWIGEGLTKIGAFKTLNVKVTGKEDIPLLTLTNYQAKLPGDLFKLVGVAYAQSPSGPFIPLRYGTGTYDARGEGNELVTGPTEPATTDIIALTMGIYDLTYREAVDLLNSDPITEEKMRMLLIDEKMPTVQQQTNLTIDYTYVVNSSYIKTNIRDGYLMIAYGAIPTDDDGYPLVPDDPAFTEALYWYVVQKYWYPDWASGLIRDRVYYDAKRSWNFYRKQAYAHAMMPSADQMESLKNQTLKLYPEINDFNNFFSNTGEQQILYRN
jgi:hypothetical protein